MAEREPKAKPAVGLIVTHLTARVATSHVADKKVRRDLNIPPAAQHQQLAGRRAKERSGAKKPGRERKDERTTR